MRKNLSKKKWGKGVEREKRVAYVKSEHKKPAFGAHNTKREKKLKTTQPPRI